MKNKKFNLLMLIIVFTGSSSCAQKKDDVKVPPVVTSALNAKFPLASKISWEMESENDYEAAFRFKGSNVSANFDKFGIWIETETEIKVSALPVSVQTAIKKDFAGFHIEESCKIENSKGENSFEVEIEIKEDEYDLLFNVDGKLLSKVKKVEEED